MNFSQTAEYSRVYILDVHGTNKQNTCAPTTQFKKKEIVKLWKPSIHRREEPRSWILCQSLAIFFFLFQFNSKVCNRNQSRTYTYTKHLKPRSPLGAACRCQPALPPLRPLVPTQGPCVKTAFPGGKAAHLPYLHTHRALHTVQV